MVGWWWNETYVNPLAFLSAQLIHQIVGFVEGRYVRVRQHAAVEGPRVRDDLGGVFANVPHVEEDVSYIAIPGNEIELEEHTHTLEVNFAHSNRNVEISKALGKEAWCVRADMEVMNYRGLC